MTSRQQALRRVASWVAKGINNGEIEFVTGIPGNLMTPQDWDAYTWAVSETRRGLLAMGAPPTDQKENGGAG